MAWSKTYEGDAPERVNKWLAQSGVCSRREAEALIAQGLVSIDGARVEDAGRKILPGQTLKLADKAQAQLGSLISVVINKPVGFVSAQPERDQTPAARLVRRDTLFGKADAIPGPKASLAPAGRLDQDSRGLLILSEDGVLVRSVIGPASQVDKEYVVRVRGALDERKLNMLRHGMMLDGRALKPANVRVVGDRTLNMVLHEGRNRQIRRMCELVELEVVDLQRVRIGPIKLADLPEGRWRPLTSGERAALIEAAR